VLVQQVDPVGLKPAQRLLGRGADGVGSAVQTGAFGAVEPEAELGSDDDLVADRGEGFTDEGLVGEGPVALGVSKKVTPRSGALRITCTPGSVSSGSP
jgi:hypothetical protein